MQLSVSRLVKKSSSKTVLQKALYCDIIVYLDKLSANYRDTKILIIAQV